MSTLSTPKVGFVSYSTDVNQASVRSLISAVNQLVEEGCNEVHVLLNTGGGAVNYGFEAYNVLRGLPVRLITHNTGNVDSIGNVIFLAGDERRTCAHSTFMFHGVVWNIGGSQVSGQQARELLNNIDADHRRISDCVADRTALTTSEVADFFNEAATKDAAFAMDKGIVHSIADVSIPAGSPFLQVT